MHSNKLSVANVFSNSIFSMALQTFRSVGTWWTNTYSWNRTAMFSPSPGIRTSRHLHNTKALVEDVDPTRDLPTEPGETTVTECFVFAKPAQRHQNQSWTNSYIYIYIYIIIYYTNSNHSGNHHQFHDLKPNMYIREVIVDYFNKTHASACQCCSYMCNTIPRASAGFIGRACFLMSSSNKWAKIRLPASSPSTDWQTQAMVLSGGRPGKHLPAQQKLAQNHEATRKTTRTIFAIITTNPTSSSS